MRRMLYLTDNPNLGSSTRVLQDWLLAGPTVGLHGFVVAQREGDLTRWLRSHDLPYLLDPMPWPDRARPWRVIWHACRVALWARRQQSEIIHCEHNVYPFGLVLRRILGRPLLCHVHYRLERGFCEWAFRGRRAPDALVWTSRQQRDDSAAAVAGLVSPAVQHVIYLGVDLSHFGVSSELRARTRQQWGVSPDAVVVGTASAFRPRKRLEDFVAAIEQLAAEHPQIVGVMAGSPVRGDEAYARRLTRRIQRANLGARLRTLGNLEPIEPFMHAIDVFVSTSEYETFGMSVCEAMACGRPVVAYRGGSVGEVVGDAGRVVEMGDLPGLVRSIHELVEHPRLRVELGTRARARVDACFNPRGSLRDLMQLYQTMLEKVNHANPRSRHTLRSLSASAR